jgi:hypothetical protein
VLAGGHQPPLPQRPPESGIRSERAQRRRERSRIIGGEEQAVLAVAQIFPRAARAGSDHRAAGRHRLQGDEAPRLLPSNREEDGVSVGVDRRHLLMRASTNEPDSFSEPELLGKRAEL